MEEQRKPICVAHIAGGLVAGGVESVIYNYFSHMDPDDYHLIYISYNPPDPAMKKKFEGIGFQVYEVPQKKKHFFKSCATVYHILKENHVQIVHSNMTLMCFVTNLLGRMAGAKVLISHSHLALHDSGSAKVLHGFCKWLSRITATDWFACGEEASVYLFGLKPTKEVTMLYNAIDLEEYAARPEASTAIRGELSIGQETILGHIGRFTEQKNHAFLLQIFRAFLRLEPGAKLVMAGDGPLLEELKQQAQAEFEPGQVYFLGSRQDVPAILSAIDLFVFPSLYEGLPVVLLEAQAAGKKILASDSMDKKVDVTGTVHFMRLEESPARWAETAKTLLEQQQESVCKTMEGGLYDIRTQAQKLDIFYHDAVKRT